MVAEGVASGGMSTKDPLQTILSHSYYIGFLDEALWSPKDKILQENIFTMLTSTEMIS